MVELVELSRRYASDPPVMALREVDLIVEEGEWLSVVGPSGSGKSTLLSILGCLDLPTSGTYRLSGQDVASLSDRQRAAMRSRRIGFVFQGFHLLSHRPVIDNVRLAEVYRGLGRAGRRDRAMSALTTVGLEHRAEFLPTRLSGGERQRVAIARAVVSTPRLLLCDEPTGNLDSVTTAAILDLFSELNAILGLTIIMITHDESVAQRAGRRVHIIDGRLSEA